MHLGTKQKAKGKEDHEHRCATVADQWQRYADHGGQSHHHRHVNREVAEEGEGNARRDEAAEGVLDPQCRHHRGQQDHHVKSQQSKRADQTEFFTQCREDKVRVFLWQIVQSTLRALGEAHPIETARTESNLRLGDV